MKKKEQRWKIEREKKKKTEEEKKTLAFWRKGFWEERGRVRWAGALRAPPRPKTSTTQTKKQKITPPQKKHKKQKKTNKQKVDLVKESLFGLLPSFIFLWKPKTSRKHYKLCISANLKTPKIGPKKSRSHSGENPFSQNKVEISISDLFWGGFCCRELCNWCPDFFLLLLPGNLCEFSFISLQGLCLWSSMFVRFSGDGLPCELFSGANSDFLGGSLGCVVSPPPSPSWTDPGWGCGCFGSVFFLCACRTMTQQVPHCVACCLPLFFLSARIGPFPLPLSCFRACVRVRAHMHESLGACGLGGVLGPSASTRLPPGHRSSSCEGVCLIIASMSCSCRVADSYAVILIFTLGD